jgi:hypothetical protein
MAVACTRHKFVAVSILKHHATTVSLLKPPRNDRFTTETDRFTTETAVSEMNWSPGSRSGLQITLELLESSRYNSF